MSRLVALEPVLSDYLSEAADYLLKALPAARPAEQLDILCALNDLRAEAAGAILPLLADPHFAHADLAIEVLGWSKDERVGPALRSWAVRRVAMDRRALKRIRAEAPPRRSVPSDIPYRAILLALRGHPSAETENFLVLAARDFDPTYRMAAITSLGWWEPIDRSLVLGCLQHGRRDCSLEVRQAIRAALARLGERQALQWFRQSLCSENPHAVHEAIQIVTNEGITLLWPEIDHLADADDADVAHHAREAVARFREDMDRRNGKW
jgi:hypothetical protein